MKNWRTSCIRQTSKPPGLVLLALAALVVLLAGLRLCLGAEKAGPLEALRALLAGDVRNPAYRILRYIRLPRTCGALLAGAALAVSGAIIQAVLANPLAAPNIIGVNAGAGLLTALCCALFPAAVGLVPLAAFLGAFCSVGLVLFIAERTGASRMTLVLAGVAVSSVFSAGVDAVVTLIPDALTGYSDFRVGGLTNVPMSRLIPAAWVILLCLALAMTLHNELDVLALGADIARSLGLPVKAVRLGMLALAAALAGAAVSFSGLLGFVGLIVPHIMRRLVGGESGRLLPAAALGGAALLTGCDLLARVLFAPYELPVGIVLSFVGGPFFIWLLLRQRGGRIHD